ncbi:unnamed protein product [Lactuca virosa]|uniref:Uncharacterized protein n=1 Tax=Lactuca virosa TaxID=75947 RepID=A0AAU9P7N7_9ASTR|nr:unnamed protein product [Lactuca virosa]
MYMAPIAVVSRRYLAPCPVNLTIVREVLSLVDGNFAVTNGNGDVVFKVQGKVSPLRRRVLVDASGNPIVSFQKKLISAYKRWVVFRGDSSDPKDIIFSAKQGSWFTRSWTIYAGDTTTIVAQMHKEYTIQSIALGKDTFTVTVYPNVDYVFIIALVVILHEIRKEKHQLHKRKQKTRNKRESH